MSKREEFRRKMQRGDRSFRLALSVVMGCGLLNFGIVAYLVSVGGKIALQSPSESDRREEYAVIVIWDTQGRIVVNGSVRREGFELTSYLRESNMKPAKPALVRPRENTPPSELVSVIETLKKYGFLDVRISVIE